MCVGQMSTGSTSVRTSLGTEFSAANQNLALAATDLNLD